MTGFKRTGSEWEAFTAQSYVGGEFSGSDTLGYYWESPSWVLWQSPSFDAALTKPANVSVVADDQSALFTWTNTAIDPDYLPTDVQVRVTTTTTTWTELTYPATSWAAGFLAPATDYLFQIRYVRRDGDGLVEAEGEIVDLFFTSDALDGPGTPAADPGGTGPDTTIPWSDTGDPGPVGGPGTWWEWIVQIADTPASGTITFADTAVTGSMDGDLGSLEIDFVAEGLACGQLARMKYRENDDGVPGDYMYGDPFTIPCDWDASCGGVTPSKFTTGALFSDPDILHAMPNVCIQPGDPMAIEDFVVSGLTYGKLDGLLGLQNGNVNHTIYGKAANSTLGTPTVAGKVGPLALQTDGDGFSATLTVNLDVAIGGGDPTYSVILGRWGRNVTISAVYASSTTWTARATYQKTDGGVLIEGSIELPLDTDVTVTLTINDALDEQKLYVNGELDADESLNGPIALENGGMGEDFQINLPSSGQISQCAAWSRVLTADEVSALVPFAFDWPYSVATTAFYPATKNSSNVVAIPDDAQTGDLMVITVGVAFGDAGAGTWGAAPTGWTLSNSNSAAIYWKVLETGDTAPTISWSGFVTTYPHSIHVDVIRNVNQTAPWFESSGPTLNDYSFNSTTPAVAATPYYDVQTDGGVYDVFGEGEGKVSCFENLSFFGGATIQTSSARIFSQRAGDATYHDMSVFEKTEADVEESVEGNTSYFIPWHLEGWSERSDTGLDLAAASTANATIRPQVWGGIVQPKVLHTDAWLAKPHLREVQQQNLLSIATDVALDNFEADESTYDTDTAVRVVFASGAQMIPAVSAPWGDFQMDNTSGRGFIAGPSANGQLVDVANANPSGYCSNLLVINCNATNAIQAFSHGDGYRYNTGESNQYSHGYATAADGWALSLNYTRTSTTAALDSYALSSTDGLQEHASFSGFVAGGGDGTHDYKRSQGGQSGAIRGFYGRQLGGSIRYPLGDAVVTFEPPAGTANGLPGTNAAATFVASTASEAGVGAATAVLPSGVAAGDLLICFASMGAFAAGEIETQDFQDKGWAFAHFQQAANRAGTMGILWKFHEVGETMPDLAYSGTTTKSNGFIAMQAWRGATGITEIGSDSTGNADVATDAVRTPTTMFNNDTLLRTGVCFQTDNSVNNAGPSAAMTIDRGTVRTSYASTSAVYYENGLEVTSEVYPTAGTVTDAATVTHTAFIADNWMSAGALLLHGN